MSPIVSGNSVTLGVRTFALEDFPDLLRCHLNVVSGTLTLEERGARLRESALADENEVEEFVRDVCRWGGYAGIGGRIINQNTLVAIREAFCTACAYLEEDPPSVYWAIRSINGLKQLQRISFASKHLRLLRPDLCPVLDSLLSA